MSRLKKSYTLIEIAVAMIILSIFIGISLNVTKMTYDKNHFEDTKTDLKKIKASILAYAAVNLKLPQIDSDSNGVGDTNGTIGELPFTDLNLESKDPYGIPYSYDVLDSLTLTDKTNFCNTIVTESSATNSPRVSDHESTPNLYTVAAVIIAKGKDKVLTGYNDDGTRIYEMKSNQYNDTTNNDITQEITLLELYGNICNANEKITVTATGGDIGYKYDNSGTCTTITNGSTAQIEQSTFTSVEFCGTTTCAQCAAAQTYLNLKALDSNGNLNILVTDGNPPTLSDN